MAQPLLTFLHTAEVHIATFEQLLAARSAAIPRRHIVAEHLLRDARAEGLTPAVRERVAEAVRAACSESAVVVCTCSTIGGLAEHVATPHGCLVLRVDRAMAEQAVYLGRNIVVIAALESTIAPTRDLIAGVAAQQGIVVELHTVVCADAWPWFEQGDREGYIARVTACIREHSRDADVVVLAQASMAPAAERCADLGVPILSSPSLGLNAAIAQYQKSKGEWDFR